MRNLKSKVAGFTGAEILSKSQLNAIIGGSEVPKVKCSCSDGSSGTVSCSTAQECVDNCIALCAG
jgi:hypothetical protein